MARLETSGLRFVRRFFFQGPDAASVGLDVRTLASRCHCSLMTADDVHSGGIDSWHLIQTNIFS